MQVGRKERHMVKMERAIKKIQDQLKDGTLEFLIKFSIDFFDREGRNYIFLLRDILKYKSSFLKSEMKDAKRVNRHFDFIIYDLASSIK